MVDGTIGVEFEVSGTYEVFRSDGSLKQIGKLEELSAEQQQAVLAEMGIELPGDIS